MAGDRWGEHSWVFVKDLYSRPLGAPKGPAAEPKHNVFTRSFAHLDVRLEVDCPHIPRNCSQLTWHRLKSDDSDPSLTGNWSINITQPKGIQHIEVWQTGTQLYIRTDTWGARPSSGTVDLKAMTATVKMVGGASEVARIERNFSFLAFPDCPSNCWCKFPHCPMPEPEHWKPYPPVAPPPPPLAVPPYPALAPPFPQTYTLNRSTIIHTSNLSGWTHTASAVRYGIVSFDVSGDASRLERFRGLAKPKSATISVEQREGDLVEAKPQPEHLRGHTRRAGAAREGGQPFDEGPRVSELHVRAAVAGVGEGGDVRRSARRLLSAG